MPAEGGEMSVVRPRRKQKWGVTDINCVSFYDTESTQPPYFIKWGSLPLFNNIVIKYIFLLERGTGCDVCSYWVKHWLQQYCLKRKVLLTIGNCIKCSLVLESWYVVFGKQLFLLPCSQIIVKYIYNNGKHDTVKLLGILYSATAEELSY